MSDKRILIRKSFKLSLLEYATTILTQTTRQVDDMSTLIRNEARTKISKHFIKIIQFTILHLVSADLHLNMIKKRSLLTLIYNFLAMVDPMNEGTTLK